MQKLRVEMAAMKRDAEHYSRQVTSTESESHYQLLLFTFYQVALADLIGSLLNPLAFLFH